MTKQEAYDIIAEKMDKRDIFYLELQKFHDAHGTVPREYALQWLQWVKQGKKKWRDIPGINKRLWKSSKKMARNSRSSKKDNNT